MLLDDLTGALGDVDVTATVSGLDVTVDVDLGEAAFDAGGLTDLVAELAPPELSGATEAVADAVDAIESGAELDPAALLEPLRAKVELAELLSSVRVDELAADLPTELGWDGLQARISGAVAELETGAPGELLGTMEGLVPGLDLRATLGDVAPKTAGVVALVQILGALLAYETVSADLERGAARVRGGLRAEVVLAAGARLSALAADPSLAAAIRAADPSSQVELDLLGRRVVTFLDALHETVDLWSTSLAYAEAAAVGVDVPGATAQLTGASRLLATGDLAAVGQVAQQIRGLIEPVTRVPLPDPVGSLDAAMEQALEMVDRLRAAVDDVDATALVQPVSSVIDDALLPVSTIAGALEEVGTSVTSALRQLQQAVEAVDLTPVASQVRAALQPVQLVLDAVADTVADAQSAIEEVAGHIQTVLDDVRDAIATAAATVRSALAAVESALATVDFADIQVTLESGIGDVTNALAAARLDPYFGAAGDAIDTTADVVDAVPFELLPADLQQEIVDAVRPIKQIDVDGIATTLRSELAAITAALDTDVLTALDDAYREVVDFLAELDPCGPLVEFEEGPFAELRTAVDAVDPRSLLTPIEEALAGFRGVLDGVDLQRDLLDPLDEAFGSVRSELDALDPAVLLEAPRDEVDALRGTITDVLLLDEMETQLDRLRDGLAGLLGRLDPEAVAGLLDGALVRRLESQPADAPGLVATLLAGLGQASGLHASASALVTVLTWLDDVDGAAVVRGRLRAAADDLEAAATVTAQLDPAPLVTAARSQHRRLLEAVRAHPGDTLLRRHLEPALAAVDVDRVAAGLLTNRDRAHGRVSAAATGSAALTASARGEITVATDGLVDALRPLTSLGDWLRAVLARFGVSDPDAPLDSLLRTVWETFGPDRVLPALAGLASVMRDLALEILDALAAPVREAIAEVRGAIELLDLGPVIDLAAEVHSEVGDAIDALDPAALLGPAVAEAQQLVDQLEVFDPLAPVRTVIDDLDATIEETFDTLRPTVLFADACDIHQQLLDLAAGLDVRGLLEPVLAALDDLRIQLDEGLEETAAALVRLQAALPGEVTSTSVSGSVSVEIGL